MDNLPTKPFKEHKDQAVKAQLKAKYSPFNPKKAVRCELCGTYLTFQPYEHTQTQERKYELIDANFCGCRWCPTCEWLKCRKLITELHSVFSQIQASHSVAYLFLTLTTKNTPLNALRASVKHLSLSFARLARFDPFARSVLGYLRAIEFLGAKTPKGQAHPHFHTLLVVKPSYFKKHYLSQAKWTELWQQALKVDYTPIVDIRRIRPKKLDLANSANIPAVSPALTSALLECVKYSVKPSKLAKMSRNDFQILDQEAKGLRQYNKGGLLKQYKPQPETDVLDENEWERLELEFWRWCGAVKDYLPITSSPR
ncbi:hypothetical protein NHP190002_15460 [Helicobacter ailurogastricus]|uniref:protein rep n=1 Tax=Helicobacter ailurogastricus TaxID=1578720 RepID=UPI00244D8FD9|nr:protein rep [Helicobacter ailurogastricus]GMB90816.1 hypothetical protein NHP190002_15460 [Helicobacter ailurogastricus]